MPEPLKLCCRGIDALPQQHRLGIKVEQSPALGVNAAQQWPSIYCFCDLTVVGVLVQKYFTLELPKMIIGGAVGNN